MSDFIPYAGLDLDVITGQGGMPRRYKLGRNVPLDEMREGRSSGGTCACGRS